MEVLGGKQCSICLHVLRAWAGTHIKSHESSNKHKEAIFRREVCPCKSVVSTAQTTRKPFNASSSRLVWRVRAET